MRCHSCGHDNRKSARHCEECGARLFDQQSGDLPLSRTNRRRYEGAAEAEQNQGSPFSGAKLTRREREIFDGDPFRGRSAKGTSAAFRIMLVALALMLVTVGAAWGFSHFFSKAEEEISGYMPDIEAGTDSDGNGVHILTFYGEKGDILYIRELRKNYTIESDNVRITIPDSHFISGNPDASTTEVTLHPVLYPLGKKSKELSAVTYVIEVPPSPIAVLQPEGGRDTSYKSIYLIKVQVEPQSIVTIAGLDVTDMVDADNIISHNVEVAPIGDNLIEIQVATPGYRTSTQQVVINRPYMDIPLEISATAPINTTSSRVTISGKTVSGANIAVEPGGEVEVDADGSFTATIRMPKAFSENTFTFTASMAGKEDTSIEHTIYYAPTVDEYSRNAWQMNYDDLIKNQAAYQGRAYLCRGRMVQVLSSDPFLCTFNVGTQSDPKLIVVEFGKYTPENTEKSYDVWADLDGKHEGMPRFICRFLYVTQDKE